MRFPLLLASTLLALVPSIAAAEDLLLHAEFPDIEVKVDLYVPEECRPVRGLLVHCAHYKIKTTGRWPTLCRELGFAHASASINLKKNNRPKKLREGLNRALEQFAKEHDMPELTQVPRMGTGMSAGGMCIPMLMPDADKMLTNAVSCSWVARTDKVGEGALEIPMLFVIGAVPDAFKMLPAIDSAYVPAVKGGAPWALGLQHECKHDWANSGTLFVPWMRGVAKLRLPEGEVKPGQPVPLAPVDFKSGWYGDRSTIDGQFATISTAAEYKGKPENVVWLPDRATAYVWRAWQTKDSPVQLTAQSSDGSKKLPGFNPKRSFGMSVAIGDEVILGVKAEGDSGVSSARFYADDQLIGEPGKDGVLSWKPEGPRAYAVFVEYEIGGQKKVSNPALICVE